MHVFCEAHDRLPSSRPCLSPCDQSLEQPQLAFAEQPLWFPSPRSRQVQSVTCFGMTWICLAKIFTDLQLRNMLPLMVSPCKWHLDLLLFCLKSRVTEREGEMMVESFHPLTYTCSIHSSQDSGRWKPGPGPLSRSSCRGKAPRLVSQHPLPQACKKLKVNQRWLTHATPFQLCRLR